MDHLQWKRRIVSACKKAGTYQKCFTDVIGTLAQIMEDRDKVHEQYVEDGCRPTVIHTNKAKEQNIVKNPMLVMEMDLNAQALAYWRELGLTAKAYKALGKEEVTVTGAGLEKILEGLAND